jgi:hypothetical protein
MDWIHLSHDNQLRVHVSSNKFSLINKILGNLVAQVVASQEGLGSMELVPKIKWSLLALETAGRTFTAGKTKGVINAPSSGIYVDDTMVRSVEF